jgi:hypothetical protein
MLFFKKKINKQPEAAKKIETPEAEYNKLIGMGYLFRSDAKASIAISSNNMAFKRFADAAELANNSNLGAEKVRDAAQKAYDATFKAGEIAFELGKRELAAMSFDNALATATIFELGKEAFDKALCEAKKVVKYNGDIQPRN